MNVVLRDGMPLLYIAILDLLYYLKSMMFAMPKKAIPENDGGQTGEDQ